ncbi:MAG TPA: phage scaffolding protein [Bacillota bacterium]|nr:hypothetical protein [Clostridiales bacterium]HOQ15067.1 phage scaffolding protein [Bacillota bacterium]HPU17303.1 phage scaffolding protein [Bacillota bacterium]
MDKSFLLSLGIGDDAADAILAEAERSIKAAVDEATSLIKAEFEEKLRAFSEEAKRSLLWQKLDFAIERELSKAGARNIKAAKAILNFTYDGGDFEGTPEGLTEAVRSLAEAEPYLFGSDYAYGGDKALSFVGISPAEESDDDFMASDLTYSEYLRLYGKN